MQKGTLHAQWFTLAVEFKRFFSPEANSKPTIFDIKKYFSHYLQFKQVF